MNLDQDIIEKLEDPLDPSLVATRKGRGGQTLSYLEGYVVIDRANEIFGHGNWGYRVVSTEENKVGCKATVEFYLGSDLVSRDVGFNEFSFSKNNPGVMDAGIYDTAYKGAVTDGMKRCMRIMGAQFGNSLYGGESAPASETAPQPPHPMASGPPSPPPAWEPTADDPYTGKSDEPARQGGSVCACGGTIGQKSDGSYFEACWKCNDKRQNG